MERKWFYGMKKLYKKLYIFNYEKNIAVHLQQSITIVDVQKIKYGVSKQQIRNMAVVSNRVYDKMMLG